MGSSRLPGKTLIKLDENYSTLDYVINQLSHSNLLDKIIVATTNLEQDDIIEKNLIISIRFYTVPFYNSEPQI